MSSLQPPKISLESSAIELEALASKIETLEELPNELERLFSLVHEEMKDAVDRRIRYLSYLKSAITGSKEMRDAWTKRAQILDRIEAWIKQNTAWILERCPELKFKGSIGELRLQKNSQATLVLDETVSDFRGTWLDDSFPDTDKEIFQTIKEYLDAGFKLNTERIKEDLEEGKSLPFAKLETGLHVRVKI